MSDSAVEIVKGALVEDKVGELRSFLDTGIVNIDDFDVRASERASVRARRRVTRRRSAQARSTARLGPDDPLSRHRATALQG